jgi:hypothetical protein
MYSPGAVPKIDLKSLCSVRGEVPAICYKCFTERVFDRLAFMYEHTPNSELAFVEIFGGK